MTSITEDELLGLNRENGARHYRAFVGPSKNYDLCAAMQFNLLTTLGLREHHYLLDIGCGSLRAGKLFIPYLLPGRYYGIEPEEWLVEKGIELELGKDIMRIKKPMISNDMDFTLSAFGIRFDYVLAQSIFTHASQSQIGRCFSEARKVMKHDSIFVATFSEGEEDYAGEEWVYPECAFYTLEKLKELAHAHGLFCRRLEWPHPDQQKWIVLGVQENEMDLMDSIRKVSLAGEHFRSQ